MAHSPRVVFQMFMRDQLKRKGRVKTDIAVQVEIFEITQATECICVNITNSVSAHVNPLDILWKNLRLHISYAVILKQKNSESVHICEKLLIHMIKVVVTQ